jgi:hypothetical protein
MKVDVPGKFINRRTRQPLANCSSVGPGIHRCRSWSPVRHTPSTPCWSVAVAADPAAGPTRFEALAGNPDPDVAWIARENRKKARLVRALDAAGR